ncbi:MAG: hypothetical protein GY928_31820 [Colwellia sp.]|nr:hypothetical protein [Colwellia sp.]
MDSTFYYYSLFDLAWCLMPLVIFIYILKSSWFKKAVGEKQLNKLKKLKIPICLIVFSSLAYFAFMDDELNPEIVQLLEDHSKNISKSNNGSVYHLGMWSSFDSSPYEVGLWRIKQYENAYLNAEFPTSSIDYEDYPKDKWTEELFAENDKPKWLCDYDESDCLDLLYSNSADAIYLAKEFNKHISRYDGVLNYSYFGLSHEPSVFSPMMMFGPGIDVLKIKLISYFHDFKQGNQEAIVNNLTRLLNHHKTVLDQTPYTVSKVISVVELQLIYEAAAYLISKTSNQNLGVWKPYINALKQFNKNQITFEKPFLHEFASSYKSFEMAGLGDFRKDLPSVIGYLPKSYLFKPNKTANLMFKALMVNRGKYEFSGDRIIVHKKPDVKSLMKFELSNPIGSLLAITATPRYLNLDGQLYNLEVIQRLTKHLYHKRLGSEKGEFISPYTGKKGNVIDKLFCIDSESLEDEPICLSTI